MTIRNSIRHTLGALLAAAVLVGPAHAAERATAPRPIGPFMLFFDRGSADVTPQGAAILDNVAAAVGQQGPMEMFIAGHADGAEADGNNVSFQRAVNVRAYLVAHGVEPTRIALIGFGAARPLVETTDSEPQNRRVEIVANP